MWNAEVTMRNAAVVVLMLVATVPAFGDQPAAQPTPQSKTRFGALRPADLSGPYSNLFKAQEELKQAVEEQASNAAKRRVVCGMTIIEADPKIDPQMAFEVPKPPDVKYTIRAIDPPICNPNR
jgi:hypothetical protein